MSQLTIYLGSRCNLNCAYCHRTADEKESVVADSLLNYIVQNQDGLTVKFMGGEPTLYMQEIERVVSSAPKAHYAICTNGVNLERYIGFFSRHDFLLCISYDGSEESLRGFDPFTKLIDYPRLAVSTTIYHGNTDLRKIMKSFAAKERIIGRPLSFFPHIAHDTSKVNAAFALTATDADSYVTQYKELVSEYMEGRYKYGVRNFRLEGMFTALKRRYEQPFSFGETYCVNSRVKKCDAAGRFYTCLYIRDDLIGGDNWQSDQQALLLQRFPKCGACDVYAMCGGACVKSLSHGIECGIYKRLYSWFKEEYPKWRGGRW